MSDSHQTSETKNVTKVIYKPAIHKHRCNERWTADCNNAFWV